MYEKASRAIYDALGFSPEQIPFDSNPLLAQIDNYIEQYGEGAFCSLRSVSIAGRKYYTSCDMVDISNIDSQSAPSNLLRLKYARNETVEQRIAYEDGADFRADEPVCLVDDDGKVIGRAQQIRESDSAIHLTAS